MVQEAVVQWAVQEEGTEEGTEEAAVQEEAAVPEVHLAAAPAARLLL